MSGVPLVRPLPPGGRELLRTRPVPVVPTARLWDARSASQQPHLCPEPPLATLDGTVSPKAKIPASGTFVSSSALHGAGSVLNIGGRPRPINLSSDDATADSRALARDWKIVGRALRDATASARR